MELIQFVLLVVFGLTAYYYLSRQESYNNQKVFTIEELSRYDGRDGKVYVAVNGMVFDVSKCESYLPGGNYCAFGGKDATVALAKMSVKPEDMNIKVKLNAQEKKTLQEWITFYRDQKNTQLSAN